MSDIESLGKKRKRGDDSVGCDRDEESEAKKVKQSFHNCIFYWIKNLHIRPGHRGKLAASSVMKIFLLPTPAAL